RWVLTEAAQKIPTGSGPLRAQYERIAKRRGPKIAKVAVARQILTLCYYGLRDGEIRCLTHNDPVNDELATAASPAHTRLALTIRARGARPGELRPVSGRLLS